MTTAQGDFKIRTPYNRIDAVYDQGVLRLHDRNDSLHSVLDLASPHRLMMENLQMLTISLLFLPNPQRVLLLGVAAGSLIHFLRHYYPACHIDAVDIDGEMIDLLIQQAYLPEPDHCLTYHRIDAFDFLASDDQQYDLIFVDLFVDTFSPPALLEMKTQQRLRERLSQPGIVASNLLIENERDYQAFYNQLLDLFDEQLLQLRHDELENQVLLGFKGNFEKHSMSDLLLAAQRLSDHHGFDHCATLAVLYTINPVGDGIL